MSTLDCLHQCVKSAAALVGGRAEPASSFSWWFERICKVEPGFVHLAIRQLNDADDVDRPFAIVDDAFGDPSRWAAQDASPADPRWPWHFGVHPHDVAGPDEALSGLRPLIDRVLGNQGADGLEVPSLPGGEEPLGGFPRQLISVGHGSLLGFRA